MLKMLSQPSTLVCLGLICGAYPFLLSSFASAQDATRPVEFHRIQIVDSETSRGIPAIQLETTDKRIFLTDSAGVVAFCEPDLMDTITWFTITGYGYAFPSNMFGQQGATVEIKPGGNTVLSMKRINVAQRIYRITGSGIYRDSMLLGEQVPPTQDKTRTPVTGMDSVHMAIYNNKMYWFWGDTGMTRNPLGNFKTTGATSELPGNGGLDPDRGVSLTFFRDGDGVRPMFDDPHKPIWVGGARVVKDDAGKEHLFINYTKVVGNMQGTAGSGIAEFDDAAGRLKIISEFPKDRKILPHGIVARHNVNGREYFYYAGPWANIRQPAEFDAMTDMSTLETFTCLKEGARFEGNPDNVDRDSQGNLRWAWRKNTAPITKDTIQKMVAAKAMQPDEAPFDYRDANSTASLVYHTGSIYYNPHRQRWVSLVSEIYGASFLGEVWYAEGDTPLGPFVYAQKIVTHRMGEQALDTVTYAKKEAESYSFYNPKQHPEFMKDNGRFIYFEGTYTAGFTNNQFRTPGYNYNQIMYKLDLDDPRVYMPVPVYRVEGQPAVYRTKINLPDGSSPIALAFYAPDRPRKGTVPVYEIADGNSARLSLTSPETAEKTIAFYAISPDALTPKDPLFLATVELFEYANSSGARIYAPAHFKEKGFTKSEKPLCRVWPRAIRFDPLAMERQGNR